MMSDEQQKAMQLKPISHNCALCMHCNSLIEADAAET